MQAHLGPIIDTFTPEEGVEAGRLVPVDLFMVEVEGWQPAPKFITKDGKRREVKPLEYDAAVEALVVDHKWRNSAIERIARRASEAIGTTLVLVDRLEHGRKLARQLGCAFLEGATSTSDRNDGWEGVRTGRTKLAVASKIADEGLNLLDVRFIILAGGGKAQHKIIQRLGRGRRAIEGKERLYAVDFLDQGMNLGPHTTQRLKAYRSDSGITIWNVQYPDLDVGSDNADYPPLEVTL